MIEWTITRVWQVDHKLVVADTVNEAVDLFKAYMGKDFHDEPNEIKCIGTSSALCDRGAIIKEEKK